jgi:hypothetical protein
MVRYYLELVEYVGGCCLVKFDVKGRGFGRGDGLFLGLKCMESIGCIWGLVGG